MAKGGMVRIKAKAVPEEEYEKKPFDRTSIESPRVQPLEQRYHVMGIENEDGEDTKEEAAETAAQERAENRPAKKKAKTPSEFMRQKRAAK